jgi:tetratricopeptide (TPR) repeat protein
MKKNICLFPLLALLQTTAIQAQTNTIDSLKQLLLTKLPDSSRSLILSKLGGQYMISNPDTAMILSQQGLALARQINYINGEAIGLNQTASVFNITGNYPKALEFFLEALKKGEAIGNPVRIGAALLNIGSVYFYQGDHRLAINYTLKAKDLFERSGNRHILMNSLLNLGDFYEKWNRLDSARFYTQQAYELALSLQDTDFTGMTLNNLGNIYTKMGQPVIAMEFYRSALPNLRQAGDDDALCECSLGMAKLFQKSGNKDSSVYYARLSMVTAQKGGFTNRILNASNFLSDYYKTIGMIDSAYVYLAVTISAKDSLFNQEKSRQIQNLSFNEMLRQQEKAAEETAAKQERHINIQYAIIAIGIISFTILFLLLSRSIIVNEKWIQFLGILGLLLVFEFINLVIHPYISAATHHSPLGILLISVVVAAVLVPVHHNAEEWVTHKMVAKNKRLRLAAAKRIVKKLEEEES